MQKAATQGSRTCVAAAAHQQQRTQGEKEMKKERRKERRGRQNVSLSRQDKNTMHSQPTGTPKSKGGRVEQNRKTLISHEPHTSTHT
mmetsp:Transcript_26825/g.66788  ORF Transcript_26825/g.66788 Transcript_26825/m.66788 type:complete len:87 (-) Transcript_26825:2232-2492(-)